MFRTVLRPRWLALLAVVLVAASVMARLGQWQWQRANDQGARDQQSRQAAQPPVALGTLLRARQTFPAAAADRRVSAVGRWDGVDQLLVAGRLQAGGFQAERSGFWVLTPFDTDDGDAVAVVRGWVAHADDPAASVAGLPHGVVTLSGVLRPTEPPIDRPPGQTGGLPAGQLDGIDGTQLVQRWPRPLLTGYVVQTAAVPALAGAGPEPVPGAPALGGDLAWQNLSYALQWFLFAGFGLFLWWRAVRDEHLGRLRAAPYDGGGTGSETTADTDVGVTP